VKRTWVEDVWENENLESRLSTYISSLKLVSICLQTLLFAPFSSA